MHFSQLAQAAHFRAAARASGSGGGPQADPPRVTALTALTHAPGLPSGPCRGVYGPSSSLLLSFLLLLYDLMALAALSCQAVGAISLATGLRPRLFQSYARLSN